MLSCVVSSATPCNRSSLVPAVLMVNICCQQGSLASSRTLEAAAAAPSNIALPKSVGNRFKAAYHYVVCETDYLVEPETTQDVADAVKSYRQLADSQGAELKVRASRR